MKGNVTAYENQFARADWLRRLVCAFVASLFVTSPIYAKTTVTENGIDVLLVVDASGSMSKSDPLRMRVQAANMFVNLLDKRDRLALMSYRSEPTRHTDLLALSSLDNKKTLLNAIDQITENGTQTNLHEALREAIVLFRKHKNPGRKQILLLMSDGKIDVGARNQNAKLLEKTITDVVPELKRNSIIVHSIAFSDNAYTAMLKLIAEDTHGQYYFLPEAKSIHQTFLNIFEHAKNPDMVPLAQDSFIVDPAAEEVTIVASKFKADAFIALENPTGKDLNQKTVNPNVQWFTGKSFDYVRIEKPKPGYWAIKYSEGGNRVYALSRLKLQTSLSKDTIEPAELVELNVSLMRDGNIVTDRDTLSRTKLTAFAQLKNGKKRKLPLFVKRSKKSRAKLPGQFRATFDFDDPGQYRIDITASSDDFDRKNSVYLTVFTPPAADPFAVRDDDNTVLYDRIVVLPEDAQDNDSQTNGETPESDKLSAENQLIKPPIELATNLKAEVPTSPPQNKPMEGPNTDAAKASEHDTKPNNLSKEESTLLSKETQEQLKQQAQEQLKQQMEEFKVKEKLDLLEQKKQELLTKAETVTDSLWTLDEKNTGILTQVVIGLVGLNIALFLLVFIVAGLRRRKKKQTDGIDLSKDIDELPPDVVEDAPPPATENTEQTTDGASANTAPEPNTAGDVEEIENIDLVPDDVMPEENALAQTDPDAPATTETADEKTQ